jgi:tRNA G10  N-methylase Trm11
MGVIKSVSYDQTEILQSIMTLNGLDHFDADVSYGNGVFYKNLPEPRFKYDIDPQCDGVICASSTLIPAPDNYFNSVVFDPPFLTYVKSGRTGNGNMVMANRFGGYWLYSELEEHYKSTLVEVARVLKSKGIMVFKCQDIIHNHKMHCTHVNVINWATESGFRLKDMFVLPAKSRMSMPEKEGEKKRVQKHARIYHSYFLVLERL